MSRSGTHDAKGDNTQKQVEVGVVGEYSGSERKCGGCRRKQRGAVKRTVGGAWAALNATCRSSRAKPETEPAAVKAEWRDAHAMMLRGTCIAHSAGRTGLKTHALKSSSRSKKHFVI